MVRAIPLPSRIAAVIFVVLTAILLLAPLVVIVGVSFSQSQFISFPPHGFTLAWYGKVLGSDDYVAAAFLSLRVAGLATLSATLVGGAAAIAIHRRNLPASDMLSILFLSPLVLPTIIYALGMLMLWSSTFGAVNLAALWLGHTVVAMPYTIRTTLAVLTQADPALEEAARTMGAGRLQRLRHIILPQCLPGLAAGAFFAFNVSFDEAVLSLFLRKPDLTTLPVAIYGQLQFSTDPSVAAVSTIMIALSIILILAIDRAVGISRFSRT
jgi:putative spermidine/putrescine transport system permease protein